MLVPGKVAINAFCQLSGVRSMLNELFLNCCNVQYTELESNPPLKADAIETSHVKGDRTILSSRLPAYVAPFIAETFDCVQVDENIAKYAYQLAHKFSYSGFDKVNNLPINSKFIFVSWSYILKILIV
jgi:hypothetical protein